jgi:branched-chain amino acid transport system permease protein
MLRVFIVVIIGGLGSVEGCFIGALLVGLLNNYASAVVVNYALAEVLAAPPAQVLGAPPADVLVAPLAEVSSIVLLIAVLMARPEGLIPVTRVR